MGEVGPNDNISIFGGSAQVTGRDTECERDIMLLYIGSWGAAIASREREACIKLD